MTGQLGHMGWIPDDPDYRDWKLPVKAGPPRALPPLVDLRSQLAPPYNQGSIGSCGPNAAAQMFRFVDAKQGAANVDPSRLALYYDARAVRGWQNQDIGTYLRDNLKVLADVGAAPERLWPYDTSKWAQKPPQSAYEAARDYQAVGYFRLDQDLESFKSCLADGYPFIIGSTLYSNFGEAERTGMVPMPAGAKSGGHAYVVGGYRDSDRRFICRGSWGEWGDAGDFYMPFDYLTNDDLSADPWTLRSVEEAEPIPDLDARPIILVVKRKGQKHKYLVWVQDASPDADLIIDGSLTDVGFADGRFVLRRQFELGQHVAVVVNGNGKDSPPYLFEVTE